MKIAPSKLAQLAFFRPSLSGSASNQSIGWHQRTPQQQRDHDLRRALATNTPDLAKIDRLLAEGANPAATSLKRGDNAIHALARACIEDKEQASRLIEQLTSHGSIDIHAINAQGDTPLHLALENQSEVASALLKKGGANQSYNRCGQSLADIASEELEDALRTAHFSYSEREINQADSTKPVIQALHRAIRLNDAVKRSINQLNQDKQKIRSDKSITALNAAHARAIVLAQELAQEQESFTPPENSPRR